MSCGLQRCAPAVAVVAAALGLAWGGEAVAQFRAAGSEFVVNPSAAGDQQRPDVAGSPTGGFTVVWHGDGDGDGSGVFLREFDGVGVALGGALQVNSFTTADQSDASISADAAGARVVVWSSAGQDGSGDGIYAQRLDASGLPVGTEFAVNTYTTGAQAAPHVAHEPGGGFLVVWSGPGAGDPDGGVYARRFDAAGAAAGGAFRVNSYTTGLQEDPEVSSSPAGGFVVTWTSADGQDGDQQGVYAQRFDAAAAAAGTEFQVAEITTVGQLLPSVAHSGGRFMIGWRNNWIFEHILQRVSVRVYDETSGAELSGEIGAIDTVFERLPQVAGSPASGFLVVESEKGLRSDSLGFAVGSEFPTHDDVIGGASFTRAILDDNGDFVLAWEARDVGDPSRTDIRARRFCADASPSCDLCPGFDDSIDDDGDGTPNGCDPCNNIAGAVDAVKAKLAMIDGSGQIGVASPKSRFKVRADVDLASAFTVLDPLNQGLLVRIENAAGQRILEAALPGGAFPGGQGTGWKRNGSATKWTYRDRSATPVAGIIKATIRDRSSKAPGRVSLAVKGRGAAYKSDEPLPYRAVVRLGNAAAGTAGLCVETAFVASACSAKPKTAGGVVRCK